MMDGIKCRECGHEPITMMVSLFVQAPSTYLRKLSKEAIRKKEIIIVGADWGNMSFYCEGCGRVTFLGRDKPHERR